MNGPLSPAFFIYIFTFVNNLFIYLYFSFINTASLMERFGIAAVLCFITYFFYPFCKLYFTKIIYFAFFLLNICVYGKFFVPLHRILKDTL